jgi:preprotein translocase subunit YajC
MKSQRQSQNRRSALRNVLNQFLLILGMFYSITAAFAAGVVTHVSGTLVVKRADGTEKLLSLKSELQEGDTLVTQGGTYARIKFDDGGEIVLRPNSQLKVDRFQFREVDPTQDSVGIALLKGGLRTVTGLLGKRNPGKFIIVTPTSTIGIRGTHFGLLMCQDDCEDIPTINGQAPENGLHIDVADGAISVTNSAGEQILVSGQFGFVKSIVTLPIVVPPANGIQVTMPSHISQNRAAGKSLGKNRESAECAVE